MPCLTYISILPARFEPDDGSVLSCDVAGAVRRVVVVDVDVSLGQLPLEVVHHLRDGDGLVVAGNEDGNALAVDGSLGIVVRHISVSLPNPCRLDASDISVSKHPTGCMYVSLSQYRILSDIDAICNSLSYDAHIEVNVVIDIFRLMTCRFDGLRDSPRFCKGYVRLLCFF